MQEMNTTFKNQSLVVWKKRTFFIGIKIFNTFPRSLKILKKEEANFKGVVRKYLIKHSF